MKGRSGRLAAHCGMAFAKAWQGLELMHDADPWGAIGDDMIGPVDGDDVVALLVELLADVELEDDEVVWELLVIVLVGREEVGELDGATDVAIVVVAGVTDGRAARQVQTAWADEDAGKAPVGPQEVITHSIAKFAMLCDCTTEQGHLISPGEHPMTEAALLMQPV